MNTTGAGALTAAEKVRREGTADPLPLVSRLNVYMKMRGAIRHRGGEGRRVIRNIGHDWPGLGSEAVEASREITNHGLVLGGREQERIMLKLRVSREPAGPECFSRGYGPKSLGVSGLEEDTLRIEHCGIAPGLRKRGQRDDRYFQPAPRLLSGSIGDSPVTVLELLSGAAWAWCIARHLAPCRGIVRA
jgi:hypothetical protein